MDSNFLIFAIKEGLKTLLIIITPLMVIPMIVGIIISIFQAVTQIQDQLLSFLPKFIIIILLLLFGLPFGMNVLGRYLNDLLVALPNYI